MNQNERSSHVLAAADDPLRERLLVDGFRFRNPKVCAYILSHAHSDHYTGLDEHFPWQSAPSHGPLIYCTEITADLIEHLLGVNSRWFKRIPFDTPTRIDLGSDYPPVEVVMIPANHCPGSAIMLFALPVLPSGSSSSSSTPSSAAGAPHKYRLVLHTGDMRFSPGMLNNPFLKAASEASHGKTSSTSSPSSSSSSSSLSSSTSSSAVSWLGHGLPIDELMLDTTYGHPKHVFLSQQDSLAQAVEMVRPYFGGLSTSESLVADTRSDGQGNPQTASSPPPSSSAYNAAELMFPSELGTASGSPSKPLRSTVAPLLGAPHPSTGNTLFLVSTYVVGKERLLLALGRSYGLRIYVSPRKYELVRRMGLQPSDVALFTSAKLSRGEAPHPSLHVVRMDTCGRHFPYFMPDFGCMRRYAAGLNRLHALHALGLYGSASSSGQATGIDIPLEGEDEDDDEGRVRSNAASAAASSSSSASSSSTSSAAPSSAALNPYGPFSKELEEKIKRVPPYYTRVVGILPTGWVHSNKKKQYSSLPLPEALPSGSEAAHDYSGFYDNERPLASSTVLSSASKSEQPATASSSTSSASSSASSSSVVTTHTSSSPIEAHVHLLPYSEHSSFPELEAFVKFLRPRKLSPHVYSDERDREKIVSHFSHLLDNTAAKRAFFQAFGNKASKSPSGAPVGATASHAQETSSNDTSKRPKRDGGTGSASASAGLADDDDDDGAVVLLDDDEDDDAVVADATNKSPAPSAVAADSAPAVAVHCHSCNKDCQSSASATSGLSCSLCGSEFVERIGLQSKAMAYPTLPLADVELVAEGSSKKGEGSHDKTPGHKSPSKAMVKTSSKAVSAPKSASIAAFFAAASGPKR